MVAQNAVMLADQSNPNLSFNPTMVHYCSCPLLRMLLTYQCKKSMVILIWSLHINKYIYIYICMYFVLSNLL